MVQPASNRLLVESQRGAPNGIASLDDGSKLPTSQLPSLDAIIAAAAAVVGKVAKGELVINVRDYLTTPRTAGTTDDTAAFTAAFAAGVAVFAPDGVYATATGISVPTRKALYGTWARSYTGSALMGARIKALSAAQTGSVITLGYGAQLTGVAISGGGQNNSPQHDALTLGGQNVVRDVTIYDAKNGVNCAYTNGNTLNNIQSHYNSANGILNPLDSKITECTLNSNTNHGIYIQNGGGDNTISSNKIEWNNGHGIMMDGAGHCTIFGNVIDRNGKVGINTINTTGGVIGPNFVRRNGRLSSGVSGDDVNIKQGPGNTNVHYVGNITENGADDGGGGYNSPATALREEGGTNIVHVGNDYKGGVTTKHAVITAGTNMSYVSNGGMSAQKMTNTAAVLGTAYSGSVAATTGTLVGTFSTSTVPTFAPGDLYRLTINARASTGTKYAATISYQVAREGGNAAVVGSNTQTVVGTAGQVDIAGTVVTVGIVPAADGSSHVITLTNVSANQLQLRMNLAGI